MSRLLRIAILLTLVVSGWSMADDPPRSGPSAVSPEVPPAVSEALMKAREAGERKQWAEANRFYAEAVAQAPDSQPARFGLGMSLILQGKVSEGLAEMTQAVGPDPNAEALAAIAEVFEKAPPGQSEAQGLAMEYKGKAYAKAESSGYADSKDGGQLALMASLALDLKRHDKFHRLTATLIRDHPDLMLAHYFNAIRALMDSEWITAEDEILQAGRMGLPQPAVDQFLATGVHSRAQTRRYLRYTIIAVVGWVVGLVSLLVLGRLLSAMTLRSLEKDDPNQAITPVQRTLRGVYKVVIDLAGLYYYLSLPMVALLAIVVFLAMGFLLINMSRIPVKLIAVVVMFGLAMLMMIWSIIRSCFIRIQDIDHDRKLSPEEAPALWELTREVAHRVGTRPIDEVWLTNGTEMAVFERGSRRDKARDRATRVLILGLEVIEGFRLDAFSAVLAHEYGHFLHRDTAGGDVAMRVQRTMGKFAEAMIQQGNAQWWNLGWQFLRLYHFLFRRITHGASRLQEIHADRIAMMTYGKGAFEDGLKHVIRRSIETDQGRSLALHQATENATGRLHLARPDLARDASIRRQVDAEFANRWKTNTTEDDTHPSPVERMRLAERLEAEPGHAPDGWVVDLIADPDRLFGEHRGRVDSEIKEYVTAFTAYHENLVTQFDAYIAEHPSLGSARFERGNVLFRTGEIEKALRDYDEAIRLDAPHLGLCHFNRGVARGRRDDLEGAEVDFREAVRLDPELARDSWSELGDLFARSGAPDRAIDAYSTALATKPGDLDLLLKRADAFLVREDFPNAETEFAEVLRLDPICVEALIGQGRAFLGLGETEKALAAFAEALRLDPMHREARQQRTALLSSGNTTRS